MTTNLYEAPPSLAQVAAARLSKISGAEAAFLSGQDDERRIIVIAREHGTIAREALLDIEEELTQHFGIVEICVRAHQGRGPDVFAGPLRLF